MPPSFRVWAQSISLGLGSLLSLGKGLTLGALETSLKRTPRPLLPKRQVPLLGTQYDTMYHFDTQSTISTHYFTPLRQNVPALIGICMMGFPYSPPSPPYPKQPPPSGGCVAVITPMLRHEHPPAPTARTPAGRHYQPHHRRTPRAAAGWRPDHRGHAPAPARRGRRPSGHHPGHPRRRHAAAAGEPGLVPCAGPLGPPRPARAPALGRLARAALDEEASQVREAEPLQLHARHVAPGAQQAAISS
jgi:hypothetical protein